MTAAEVAKVTAIGGNGDIQPELIEEVVGEVRGYVATAGPLGPAGMIPDELKRAAVAAIVWRYVTSIPTDKLATQARKDANERAVTLFPRRGGRSVPRRAAGDRRACHAASQPTEHRHGRTRQTRHEQRRFETALKDAFSTSSQIPPTGGRYPLGSALPLLAACGLARKRAGLSSLPFNKPTSGSLPFCRSANTATGLTLNSDRDLHRSNAVRRSSRLA